MLNGKIDQIAFISFSEQDTEEIKRSLSLQDDDWIEDIVVAQGWVRGEEGVNKARLLFNYSNGIETEILQYLEGPNYAEELPPGQLCHIGMHYDGEGEVPSFIASIVQQVETISHTNEYQQLHNRHYRYTIYDTRGTHGVYMKVIERLDGAPDRFAEVTA